VSIEQRILDALNEAPATKVDLADALELKLNTVARALRRLTIAKEAELIPQNRRKSGEYRALVETTSLAVEAKGSASVAKIWNPATDQKPDWLRRSA